MKKIVATLLCAVMMLLLLTACGPSGNNSNGDAERQKIKIGYLSGPTGMGMAKLIIDNNGMNGGNEKYEFTNFADNVENAMIALTKGEVDVICMPSNNAAAYPTSADNDAKILAVNCLNSLFLATEVGTDYEGEITLADFAGKTIYTCKAGTPRLVLQHILDKLEINAEVSFTVNNEDKLKPGDIAGEMITGNIPNVVLPEPLISKVITQRNAGAELKPLVVRGVDLADEWAKIYDTPIAMGCLVADADFVNANKASIDLFLEEYKASVEYMTNPDNFDSAAEYIQETGIVPALPLARSALSEMTDSLVVIEGAEMKKTLIAFYNAIGIALPDESIYYAK